MLRVSILCATIAAVAVACLQDGLIPCGAETCSRDSACVLGKCVSTAALKSCAGLADGSPCTTADITAGVCVSSACIVAGCGNGYLEPGEVCDDGNRIGGDGCSASCDSREICGDGVTNLGEQCDCGTDPAAVKPPCTTINSDSDGNASCRSNCTLRTCGNGIVEGLEQCEPSVAIAATCTDVGFYGGTIGCTPFCTLDTTGCTGRCGDTIVQTGEQCDGSNLGLFHTCQQIGFYRGNLQCALNCSYAGCSGVCGDGVWDQADGEHCDGTSGPSCSAAGFYGPGATGCSGACSVLPGTCERCGDGIILSPFEQCDGTNLDGKTCSDFGGANKMGTTGLGCTACRFDLSGCCNPGAGSGSGSGSGTGSGSGVDLPSCNPA